MNTKARNGAVPTDLIKIFKGGGGGAICPVGDKMALEGKEEYRVKGGECFLKGAKAWGGLET